MPALSERSENLQRLKTARDQANKVLQSYPDYGKATDGYIAGIIEAFAQFDDGIQLQLAHISLGLRARHSYLPTIEDVMKLAAELLAERSRKAEFAKRFSGRVVDRNPGEPRKPFMPFPRLWTAIGPQADDVLSGVDFEVIADLAKTQALNGDEAMRQKLTGLQSRGKMAA